MEIISNYRDIDVSKLKRNDCFLAINNDSTYNSYKFEAYENCLYKFGAMLPNNGTKQQDVYMRDLFFEHNNKLFLLDSIEMKNYNLYYMEANYSEQIQSYGFGIRYGVDIFCDEMIDFLINEGVFKKDYKTKANYFSTSIVGEECDEGKNDKMYDVTFSYFSINLGEKILLIITKYTVMCNELSILYNIIDIDEIMEPINQIRNMPKKRGRKSKNEVSIETYERMYIHNGVRSGSVYSHNTSLFKNIAKYFDDKDVKRVARLNHLLFKATKPEFNFANIEKIIETLDNDFNVKVDIPIEIEETFLGYISYSINGSHGVYDTRLKKFVYDYDGDITRKYLRQDDLILTCLTNLHRYKFNRSSINDELAPLYDDINFEERNLIYSDSKYLLFKDGSNKTWYKRFGKFILRARVSDEVRERYETFEKLKEAQ